MHRVVKNVFKVLMENFLSVLGNFFLSHGFEGSFAMKKLVTQQIFC